MQNYRHVCVAEKGRKDGCAQGRSNHGLTSPLQLRHATQFWEHGHVTESANEVGSGSDVLKFQGIKLPPGIRVEDPRC